MLTIEIRVNGSIVVATTVTNSRQDGDLCEYEYQQVTFPIDNKGPPKLAHGKFNHFRSDGVNELAKRLFQSVADTAPDKP